MPDRLEYLLNEARFVRTLSDSEQKMFQRGVCGNEAFHLEIKHQPMGQRMFPATLDMKLQPLQLRKLMAHNMALYTPTVKYMEELEVVHHRVASDDPWADLKSWAQCCDQSESVPHASRSSLAMKRSHEASRFRKWAAKSMKTMKSMYVSKAMKTRRTVVHGKNKKAWKHSRYGKSVQHVNA